MRYFARGSRLAPDWIVRIGGPNPHIEVLAEKRVQCARTIRHSVVRVVDTAETIGPAFGQNMPVYPAGEGIVVGNIDMYESALAQGTDDLFDECRRLGYVFEDL